MPEAVTFSEISVGDEIPPLTLPAIETDQLARYAEAGGDDNPIHVDEAAAKATGLPGIIAHGMLNMALLARMLTDWVPQSRLREFSTRFTAMAFPGDVLTCRGTVTEKEGTEDGGGNGNIVALEISMENQSGEKVLAGKARVALP